MVLDRKREIFIKLDNIAEIVDFLTEIKHQQAHLEKLFERYDKLNGAESKTFENWNNYLEDVSQKLEHITL